MLARTDASAGAKYIGRPSVLFVFGIDDVSRSELVIEPAFGDELVGAVVLGLIMVDSPGKGDEERALRKEVSIIPVILGQHMRHSSRCSGPPAENLFGQSVSQCKVSCSLKSAYLHHDGLQVR